MSNYEQPSKLLTEFAIAERGEEMTKEALTLALEALESYSKSAYIKQAHPKRWANGNKAITAIKEALSSPNGEAQPEQRSNEHLEPVALETVYETIIHWDEGGGKRSRRELARRIVSLYTTPPQRTWVGLTPQERDEINEQVYGAVPHHVAFHHAIEAKLKEKNHEWLA